jgi:hypothetical protein
METLQRTANRGSISTASYEIDNSLKVESANSEYFIRTFSSAGTQKTGTVSFWIKRTSLGTFQREVDCSNASGNSSGIFFESDQLCLDFGGNGRHSLRSEAKLRDTSAWYHCMAVWDTTQSTDTERTKIYINGSRVTSFSTATYPSQNATSQFFTPNDGAGSGNNCLFSRHNPANLGQHTPNGYHAEFHYIDGTAKTPSDFGEFDPASGIWKPKEYTGSHGSNGFYLDFADAADLGDDESGNGNDWTEVNITAADQATDTPTNNFCTWNPLWEYLYMPVFKEGATVAAYDNSTDENAKGSIGLTNGKWYWEAKPSGTIGSQFIGIATANEAYTIGGQGLQQNYQMTIEPQGRYYSYAGSLSESSAGQFTALTTSDTLGIALDMDSSTQTIKYYANGSLILTRNLISDMQGKTVFPFLQNYESRTFNINFGGYTINSISSAASDANGYGTFEHAPPSGYYAICTKNLAEYG